MRLFKLFLLFTFLFSSQSSVFAVVPESFSKSEDCIITTTLRRGSSGEQVKCLQSIVGAKTDGLFGPLTEDSVMIWQENRGLLADGIVGPITRTALSRALLAKKGGSIYPKGCISSAGYSAETGEKCDGSQTPKTSSSNVIVPSVPTVPNINSIAGSEMPDSLKDPQKNLEAYIASVKQGLVARGESQDRIALFEEEIRKRAPQNQNTLQKFFDGQREIYQRTISREISKKSLFAFFEKTFSFVGEALFTKKAVAGAGLPFGGFITVVYEICTCDENVQQVFVALPGAPSSVSNMTLDYELGTQAFLNYNIPTEKIAVLGFYEPGIPSCWMYVGEACSNVPSRGLILPMTGSSL